MTKKRKIKLNAGMTYVELIVVLSIFAVMSSIVLFNYGKFQAKVDIKNLANDIALKIVEAQKSAMSGKLTIKTIVAPPWRPAYGVYFENSATLDTDGIPFNKKFVYFADLDQSALQSPSVGYTNPSGFCFLITDPTDECLDVLNITKGNSISGLSVFYTNNIPTHDTPADLSLTFTRPSSGATITSITPLSLNIDYAQITITSPQGLTANIKVYSSGRIQIN